MSINTLYNRVRDGEPGAEDRLFERLTDSFRLFVRQRVWSDEDVEDIVQESLIAIAGKYRGIEFETSFAAWAYKVLENKTLDYYRKKQCRESKFAQIASDESSVAEKPNPGLRRKLLDCLRKINGANGRYARILNLQYQGYSTDEVCERMDLTRNSLYILLSRARSMLKLCLQKGDIEK